MKMASLRMYVFLFCAILLMKGKVSSGVRVTLLKSAVTKGAVCLDGSAPAYQFDAGFGEGVSNWLVHLEGGAWCESPEECMKRTHNRYGLGSSFRIKKVKFKGILSKKQEYNPNFYNWNRILVKYCDGSSFTGNAETFYQGTKLYLRGARIFDAIVEDLLTRGMHNASNALLSGSSAGGLASILNCDKFRAFLPLTTKVKCISDGGYFIHAKDVYGKYQFQKVMFDRVVSLHGSVKNLPQECTSKIEPSLCFYPQFVAPFIRTPLFILNSAYDSFQIENILALTNADVDHSWVGCQYNIEKCSSSEIKILEGFRSQLVQGVLKGLHNDSSGGFFINSCYTHCQSLDQRIWLGYRNSALNNKTISDVVGEWYYDKGVVQLIDHQNQLPHWCGLDETEPNP